ncbi:MAG: multicopper oxidase family protein [Dongiaceae bacterium]
MSLSRRGLLARAGAGALCVALPALALHGRTARDYTLVAQDRPVSLLPGTTTPALAYGDGFPNPVLRVRQDERLRVRLVNRLDAPTTIHWHGLRLPNAMDGVPNLTQAPVAPGAEFIYEFAPPDAGTFWYHPHYDSLTQLNRGLAGALIVEEREPTPFDADLLLLAKDWNLDEAGQFNPLTTTRAAARAGTFGGIHTINGALAPTYDLPAGGLCRLRLLNVDVTRIFKVILEGAAAEAMIIALDGHPLATPLPLRLLSLGPGMRADLALRAPAAPGAEIRLVNTSASAPWTMVTLRTVLPTQPLIGADVRLPPNPIPEPDLADAETLTFAFAAGAGTGSVICGSAVPQPMLWSINKQAWSEVPALMPPLAGLRRGRSYILELQNATPHPHPIHLHGFAFKVLRSNEREIAPYFADTALLSPKERMTVAFVADNPGDWMLHCHIIEHQATGMTGYLHVA